MTNLKALLTASTLAFALGLSAPAFACEDCDHHAKDGKSVEKHDDHKDHGKHEGHKDGDHHDHKEGDAHEHDKEKPNQ